MSYEKIVLALACKDDEARVIQTAMELSRLLDAKLTVLHVNPEHAGEPSMLMDSPPRHDVEDVREQLRSAGFEKQAAEVEIEVVEGNSYSKMISKASVTADLVIMGHSHQNRFLEILTDTTDEKVANISGCPVMVVPKRS
jgi:nucleotide-binding universal stress UspA family protein